MCDRAWVKCVLVNLLRVALRNHDGLIALIARLVAVKVDDKLGVWHDLNVHRVDQLLTSITFCRVCRIRKFRTQPRIKSNTKVSTKSYKYADRFDLVNRSRLLCPSNHHNGPASNLLYLLHTPSRRRGYVFREVGEVLARFLDNVRLAQVLRNRHGHLILRALAQMHQNECLAYDANKSDLELLGAGASEALIEWTRVLELLLWVTLYFCRGD